MWNNTSPSAPVPTPGKTLPPWGYLAPLSALKRDPSPSKGDRGGNPWHGGKGSRTPAAKRHRAQRDRLYRSDFGGNPERVVRIVDPFGVERWVPADRLPNPPGGSA
jgi:hypothetical protein